MGSIQRDGIGRRLGDLLSPKTLKALLMIDDGETIDTVELDR
jgi:hypothetical protein